MPMSRLNVEIAKSPNCAVIEIKEPQIRHLSIEKSTKYVKERQITQDVTKFAIAPPIVLFGLISGAIFLLNLGPTLDATKSPANTAIKYIKIKCQA